MSINRDLVLDVRHEDCPIPTIRTKEILDALTVGFILKVITNQEASTNNIRTLVKNNDFKLLKELKNKDGFVFLIQK